MSRRFILTMSPEILAQRLEAAAIHYQATAKNARAEVRVDGGAVDRLAAQLDAQAAECLEWAEALRGELLSAGFDGVDDAIEIQYFADDESDRIQSAEAARGA